MNNLDNVSQGLVKDLDKDDAISRQAVDTLVDELARAISDERCFMSRGRSTATIMQDILDLPSVTCSEKQNGSGEWLHQQLIPDDVTGHMHGECSCCHKVRIVDNYCPNCGCHMVEPQPYKAESEEV